MSGADRSRSFAARVWWATLPYAGWVGWRDEELEADGTCRKPPWYAFPLAWLNRLAEKLPGFGAFEPMEPIVCNCDYCRGVPGARFEP
jgi:hypothetical protein